nr:hypothetical protein [Endozoicomonas sp.]
YYLETTNQESPGNQLVSLQSHGSILGERLKRNSPNTPSDQLTSKIGKWNKTVISLFSKRLPSLNKNQQKKHIKEIINFLKMTIEYNLFDEKFISYTQLLSILKPTHTLLTNPELSTREKKELESTLLSLCRAAQRFNAHDIEALKKFRITINSIYFNTLYSSTKNAPTKELITLLADLINDNPSKDLLFLFTRIVATFHESIDFGDNPSLDACIKKISDPEIQGAISDYTHGNLETSNITDSQNPIVLWLKSMIAHCHDLDFERAEQLLLQSMKTDPSMGLHLALLYFQQWDDPDSEQLGRIQKALTDAKSPAGIDHSLWVQCNARAVQLDLLKNGVKKSKEEKTTKALPEHHNNPDEYEEPTTEACGQTVAAEFTEDKPDSSLTSVITLIQELIELYKWHDDPAGTISETDTSDFLVSVKKGKAVTQLEWMRLGFRNPVIMKLLFRINICRVLNDLEGEINVYGLLKNQKFRGTLPVERLLEEAVWTLLHCTEDPHSGGFSSTKKERLDALNLAKQLMFICLQHTVSNPAMISEDISIQDLILKLREWLDNGEDFGNDQVLQQRMRHHIRCRAGSSLGHIFRFLQEETGRNDLEKKASMCFQAKTKFDPSYKPAGKDDRQSYYRKVAFTR